MMATKDPVHQALHAFAKGDVEAAGSILTATAGEAKARSDVESALDACCMQASLAAMEGSVVEVRRALGEAGAPSRGLIEAMQHYMEGLAALSNANYTTARRKFEAARACDSKFVLASMGLAAVYYEAKDYKKSFGEYREVISALGSEVTPPLARVGMGLCAFRLGKIPFAKKCLERALALNPDDELALLALLVVYLDLRLLSQASETVHQLQRLLPHNATVLLKVGDLLYFKSLMERRLGHVLRPLQTLLAAVRQLGTKEERAMADFQEGRALLAAGDWSAAQSRLEAALRALPHLLAARVHYARLLYYTNKVDEAVALLRSIHEQRPQEKEVLQLLALHATRTGDHSAALRYCSLLIHSNAQGDPATWALASWCARLDVEESAKLISHVIRVSHDVGQSPPFTLLANLAVLRKDVTALQAIVDAEMGVTFLTTNAPLDVQHVPLLFNLALLLEATDRTRARSLYLYLIKQQSHFTLPYFRLHDMAKEDGQVRQAVAWLTLLQQVVPDASLASAYIGQDFYDQQRHMACMEALRVQRSKSVPVALALGKSFLWCAQQRGKDSQRFLSSAKDRFLYALRQDSDNLLALHGLACCLGLEKDYDHCQSFLHRVGEAVPNVEAVRENYSVHMANVMLLCEAYKQSIDHFEQHEGSLTAAQSSAFAFCLASEARYTEAIELLEKTLTDPAATKSFPMLPYNLALLYYAHFDRIITRSASLTAEDARKLQEGLERGLSLSHAFVQQEARTQSIVTAQSFLRSVSATCLRLYETSLKQLVLMGVEKEAQIGPASQRWASAFEQYTKEMDEAREQLECMTQQEVADRDRREQVIAAERVDDQGVPVEITFDV